MPLAKKAAAVVLEVASIAPAACGSASSIRALSSVWRAPAAFHSAHSTKTSSAPMPKTAKRLMKWRAPMKRTSSTWK